MTDEKRQCTKCYKWISLDANHFKIKRDGFTKVCTQCSIKAADKYSKTKTQKNSDGKENLVEGDFDDEDNEDTEQNLPQQLGTLTLDEFINFLSAAEDIKSLTAVVAIDELEGDPQNTREKADGLAKIVWEKMDYRFEYHSKYDHKRTPSTRYMYHCAQVKTRQHSIKKSSKEGVKHRDKEQMDAFQCSGWIHITIADGGDDALVKFKHEDQHIPYWNIDVPDDVQQFVRNNLELSPTQLWDEILKQHASKSTLAEPPKFSRKSIYKIWHQNSSKKWTRDPDEIKSAKILLQEASETTHTTANIYSVEVIPLPEEVGFTAIAFCLPEVLRKWGGQIREISLDSTFKTNGSNFEVYALLGEVAGSGCPLGYLLIQSTADSTPGGKERYIQAFLSHFQTTWNLKAIITLTDKDLSEINAFRAQFPSAKHQLCFWHALRAIKTRLSVLLRRPKFYDAKEAKMEFDFIDETFVPQGQEEHPSNTQYTVAQKAIPRLTVLFQGVQQNRAPEPLAPKFGDRGRLALRLNGRVKAVIPRQPLSNDIDNNDDDDNDDEGNHLLDQVNAYVDKDAQDAEDGPDWMFEDGEYTSADPTYIFCPAAHRKQLLHLFTKHFCQHPIFPERREKCLTPKQLRRMAVYEMYDFCKVRGLREVWGYMWASWYCPKMWGLWARSTSPYLSRLRTTMAVENFWRQLKHNYLHNIARPRLDHLIWIMIYNVTPSYFTRTGILESTYRVGCSKSLTTYQRAFKKAWTKLLERAPSTTGATYVTDISSWTCNCGQQKYQPHHLCKHLIHAIGLPNPRFFREIVRRRVIPIYRHPSLVAKGSVASDYIEPEESYTDGDDNTWSGDRKMLEGNGGWQELTRKRKCGETSTATPVVKRQQLEHGEDSLSTPHGDHEIIDLTSSSPGAAPLADRELPPVPEIDDSAMSSCFEYGSGDELELDELTESLEAKAAAYERSAARIRVQIPLRNRIWMRAANSLGNDVVAADADLSREERNGRNTDTTWGIGKGKKERRRVKNTMGYMPQSSSHG